MSFLHSLKQKAFTGLCLLIAFHGSAYAQGKISQEQADQAAAFITDLGDSALTVLADDSLSDEDRLDKFATLFSKNFDTPYISRLVLGQYWKSATDDQKQEYTSLFNDYIVHVYYKRLDEYSGEQFKVLKGIPATKKDATVTSQVVRPAGGPPVSLEWRVRVTGDALKVIDVKVEDISMARSQRSEFASIIERNKKGLDGLLSELRKKAQ